MTSTVRLSTDSCDDNTFCELADFMTVFSTSSQSWSQSPAQNDRKRCVNNLLRVAAPCPLRPPRAFGGRWKSIASIEPSSFQCLSLATALSAGSAMVACLSNDVDTACLASAQLKDQCGGTSRMSGGQELMSFQEIWSMDVRFLRT